MSCTEPTRSAPWGVSALCLLLAACSAPAPAPVAPPPAPAISAPPIAAPAPAAVPVPARPARIRARDWSDFRRHAALRLVAASPQVVYDGPVPDTLLAIPVLEVELEADGRVRRIKVLRYPGQAKDTTQLAIDAVHRAAPFDDVGHLPQPWKFVEVFLFDDARRFKPRTLDD